MVDCAWTNCGASAEILARYRSPQSDPDQYRWTGWVLPFRLARPVHLLSRRSILIRSKIAAKCIRWFVPIDRRMGARPGEDHLVA